MRSDRPRAIDQYIDYFGNGAGTRSEALDAAPGPVHEPSGVERSDLVTRYDSPRP